uniref:NADH-ubiquinone oxidoreductase chain 5 n=1 Tax=Appalachioria falcifera TaxID=382869 RepID=S4T031_APPFA|nr:NADH dehydrogenase subunit 5 [Appalachioria falcifera]AFR77026.1 NADH dehydrogenase subunit 5 [Appalachioria falcifera]
MFWLYFVIFGGLFSLSLLCCFFGVLALYGGWVLIMEWVIIRVIGLDLGFILMFDWMSLFFMGVVLLISSCVFYYSVGYMGGDSNILRFGLLVLLFVISMLFVIVSPSFISILLGWDGLGLVSYCLVIYYQNYRSYNAGMITGVTNRLGDVGLLLTIGLLFSYGSWNFYSFDVSGGLWGLISILVLLAGFTKSAQIPFSAWLPAAMAAPTPVSALVHSSTLVTAGVYLLIRFYGVLGLFWWVVMLIVYGGVLTMFMAGMVANFEMDMSKIIALSTLSQLGLMMVSVGLGNIYLAFFHLVVHAIFSALLFLCGGKMIHSFGGEQDLRHMGGVVVGLPVSSVSLNVANFSLCGMPFMSGFYSKDLILEMSGSWSMNLILFVLMVVGTIFTFMYTVSFCMSSMIVYYGGWGFKWDDDDFNYLFPMVILSVGGVVSGSFLFWLGVPGYDMSFVYGVDSIWPAFLVLLGVFISWSLVSFVVGGLVSVSLSDFFGGMWFIPGLSTGCIYYPLDWGRLVVSYLDSGWGEAFGGQGLYSFESDVGSMLQAFQGVIFTVVMFVLILWVLIAWCSIF